MTKALTIYTNISKYIKECFSSYLCIKFLSFSLGILLPTHWFWHWNPAWSYWSGIMVEPWVPKVFVSSLLLILLWMTTLWAYFWGNPARGRAALMPQIRQFSLWDEQRRVKKIVWAVILGCIAILGNVTFSLVPLAALSFWLQTVTGPILLLVWIKRMHSHPAMKSLWQGVLAGVVIQALLAWWQYTTQQELGGYWLLGQPNFSSISLAKSQFLTLSITLPYGSTPHPNVLAGWLVLGISLIWLRNLITRPWLKLASSCLLLFPLAWSESWAAWFTLALIMISPRWLESTRSSFRMRWISIAVIWAVSIAVVLLSPQLLPSLRTNTSFSRREVLLSAAPRLLLQRPQGWGPVQHPLGLSPEEKQRLRAFSTQPIHAAGIGSMIDMGFWTLLLLCTFWILAHKTYSFFVLLLSLSLPIFSLDHFGYSTISGQFLLLLFVIFLYFLIRTHRPRTL